VQVFLSYRRGDVGGHAGRLTDALVGRLGAKNVFQDVTAITPGHDFEAAIDRALDDCDALLAVIGPGWLNASTPQGAPRLFEADDYVRLELARALERDIPVVPVLVGGASLPAVARLPDDLRPLVQRQSVTLRDESWHRDVEGLLRSLRGETAAATSRTRAWRIAAAATVALAAAGGVAWWVGPGAGGGDGAESALPACASPDGDSWRLIDPSGDPTREVAVKGGALVFTVEDAHWRARDGAWDVTLETTMANEGAEEAYHYGGRYSSLLVARREFDATCFSASEEPVSPGAVGDALVGFEVTCEPVGYIELVAEGGRIDVTDRTAEPRAC
jgi:hypothetical protein